MCVAVYDYGMCVIRVYAYWCIAMVSVGDKSMCRTVHAHSVCMCDKGIYIMVYGYGSCV